MPLTPPTMDDLAAFTGETYEDVTNEEADHIDTLLQQATDVVWIFTGIDTSPVDARLLRVLNNAIMDLALWLRVQSENRDEVNSPFSSERIGSYSYTKMQQAQSGANGVGDGSGLYWLDLLFRLITDSVNEGAWTTSENIFNPDNLSFEDFELLLRETVSSDVWNYGVPYRDPGV